MPAAWVTGHMLNDAGFKNLYDWSAIFFMGTAAILGGFPMRWLLAYPDAVESTLANLRGVAFRDVQFVRTLQHTEPAPDSVPVNWP
jgi:hypothetical protein